MDYSALKAELAKPVYAGLSDADAAAAVNVATATRTVPIPSSELLAWAGAAGRFVKVSAAADLTLPAADDPTYAAKVGLKSVASVARILLTRDGTELDLARTDRLAMVDGLVTAGVLTTADKAALVALGTESFQLWTAFGRTVDAGDVAAARAL